jgi:hypothetical protein
VADVSSQLEASLLPAPPELGLIVVDASGVKTKVSPDGGFMADRRNGHKLDGLSQGRTLF